MKMQNAEMEFVTFEAQDILTASGERRFAIRIYRF